MAHPDVVPLGAGTDEMATEWQQPEGFETEDAGDGTEVGSSPEPWTSSSDLPSSGASTDSTTPDAGVVVPPVL